jgi:septal ring factor EnvC (AmiA/AmiB activator)
MSILSTQQSNLLEIMNCIELVNNELDISPQVSSDLKYLSEKVTNFKILAPIIGKFSSGKTTLLKTYIETTLLKEDLTPETSFATELHFSEEERVVAHYLDDTPATILDVSEFGSLQGDDNLYYVQLFLNNPKLKQHRNLVLVDMPGFDSKNSAHHKAIACYLNRGDVFINLFPAGIPFDASIIDQMREIKIEFNKDIKCFISKSARLSPSKLRESQQELSFTLSSALGETIEVGRLESLDKTEKNLSVFENKLLEAESKFDALLTNRYANEIKKNINKLAHEITTLKQYSSSNQAELEEQLKSATQAFETVKGKLQTTLDSLIYNLCSSGKEELIKQVESALNAAISRLTIAAKSEQLDAVIGEIIRPVIQVGINRLIEREMIKLEGKLKDISSEDFQGHNFVIDLPTKDKEMLEQISSTVIATVLKFLASRVHPIAMIIVHFLSMILSSKKTEMLEEQHQKMITQQIQNDVIPQVTSSAVQHVSSELEKAAETLKQQVLAGFEQEQAKHEATIKQLQVELQTDQAAFSQRLQALQVGLEALAVQAKRLGMALDLTPAAASEMESA